MPPKPPSPPPAPITPDVLDELLRQIDGAADLDPVGQQHVRAILASKAGALTASDLHLVLEAGRVWSALARAWDEARGRPLTVVARNGSVMPAPVYRLADTLQRALLSLHRSLGCRHIDLGADRVPAPEDPEVADIFGEGRS